ncbi:MAG: hypothetical protein AB9835_12375 [Eubacteriales bacterium]
MLSPEKVAEKLKNELLGMDDAERMTYLKNFGFSITKGKPEKARKSSTVIKVTKQSVNYTKYKGVKGKKKIGN